MAIQLNTFPFTFGADLVDENQTIVNGDGVIVNTLSGNDIIKATTDNGLGIDNDGIITTGVFGNDILEGNTALIENIKIEELITSTVFSLMVVGAKIPLIYRMVRVLFEAEKTLTLSFWKELKLTTVLW